MTDNKQAIANLIQTNPALSSLADNKPIPETTGDEQVSGDGSPPPAVDETVPDGQEGTPEGEQAEEGDTLEGAEEPRFTVRVDGKELEVTQSELLAGYQRNADYTQKAQTLAAERKAMEQAKVEVGNLQKTYAERLSMLEAALKPQVPTPEQLNVLAQRAQSGDPKAVGEFIQAQTRQASYNAVLAERQSIEAQQAKQMEAELRARLETEQKALLERLPEYGKAESHTKLRSFLVKHGMSEQEVDGLVDHRAVIIADMAMKWAELQAKSPQMQKRVEGLPKLAKKVTSPSQSAVQRSGKMQAIETLESTGKFANAKQRMDVLGGFLKI